MSETAKIIFANISTGIAVIAVMLTLGGWLSADIRELRMKVDRNTETIVRLEGKVDRNTEAIARLEGVLIGDNRPVPATTTPSSSAPAQTALN